MVKHQLKMIKGFTLLQSITAHLNTSSFIIIMIILCPCTTIFFDGKSDKCSIFMQTAVLNMCACLHDHYIETENITIQVICKLFHYHIT